jgi:hypothetical protein
MDKPGSPIVGPLKPVAYLVLGYSIETADRSRESLAPVSLKDVVATLQNYVVKRSMPFNLTAGHIRAALLMLEGGFLSIQRDPREQGRNLEHPFTIHVNPSGRALYEQLTKETGIPLKNITGAGG